MPKKPKSNWESRTIEELLTLRKLIQDVLEAKIKNRRAELVRQLRTLRHLRQPA